ncbi:unnamed protein product [Diamesa tonsa]
MSSINFLHLNFEPKQEIIVTKTDDQLVFCKYDKLTRNGLRLDVLCPQDFNTKQPLGKFAHFMQRDVKSVQIFEEQEKQVKPVEVNCISKVSSDIVSKKEIPALSISVNQLNCIQNSIQNYKYINQSDDQYFKAIEDLSSQYVIGVSTCGCNAGRIFPMELLMLSTHDKVYIFDILLFGNVIFKELADILTSKTHLKIFHDCRLTLDNIHHKYCIKTNSIFDTMLAASLTHQSNIVHSLEDCVTTCTGLKCEIPTLKPNKRPLSAEYLQECASTCAYLLPLYHILIKSTFLCKYKQLMEAYCDMSHDAFEALTDQTNKHLTEVIEEHKDDIHQLDEGINNLVETIQKIN